MTFTGYIYKITGACGLIYIGSTVDLEKRKWKHNSNTYNSTCSKLLKKPLQFDIIDTREYKLMRTLCLVEQFYLDNTNTINQNRAYTNERSLGYLLIKRAKGRNYYYENKQKINKKTRENYQKNKEKYTLQKKEKIKCECGCLISRRNLSTHKRTKKHIQLMNLL